MHVKIVDAIDTWNDVSTVTHLSSSVMVNDVSTVTHLSSSVMVLKYWQDQINFFAESEKLEKSFILR